MFKQATVRSALKGVQGDLGVLQVVGTQVNCAPREELEQEYSEVMSSRAQVSLTMEALNHDNHNSRLKSKTPKFSKP